MNNNYEYYYSAQKEQEIAAIRKKYMNPEEDKFEQLKKLDKEADKRGQIYALVLGVTGALILGGGMSIVMVGSTIFMALGIIIGLAGLAVAAAAFPVYKRTVKKDREKVAARVLELADEIQ